MLHLTTTEATEPDAERPVITDAFCIERTATARHGRRPAMALRRLAVERTAGELHLRHGDVHGRGPTVRLVAVDDSPIPAVGTAAPGIPGGDVATTHVYTVWPRELAPVLRAEGLTFTTTAGHLVARATLRRVAGRHAPRSRSRAALPALGAVERTPTPFASHRRSPRRPGARWLSVTLTGLLLTGTALGQPASDAASARAIATEGVRALDGGDFATAERNLAAAYAVFKAPTVALYRARALVGLGRLVEASEMYLEGTRLPAEGEQRAKQEEAKQLCGSERAALLPRIPKLVVRVQGADPNAVSFAVDGVSVPGALLLVGHLVDPGSHVVTGTFQGAEAKAETTVAEGAVATVDLVIPKTEAPPPTTGLAGAIASSGAPTTAPATTATTERPRKSGTGMIVTGSVLMGVGSLMMIGGLAMTSGSASDCYTSASGGYYCTDSGGSSGGKAAVIGTGAVLVGAGIPVLAIGLHRHKVAKRAAVTASAGPTRHGWSGSLTLTF